MQEKKIHATRWCECTTQFRRYIGNLRSINLDLSSLSSYVCRPPPMGLKNSAIHSNPFSRGENNTNAARTRHRRSYIEFPELAWMCLIFDKKSGLKILCSRTLYAVRRTSRIRVNSVAPFTVPESPTIHLPFAMIFAVKFKILFESFFTVLRFINTATKQQGTQRDRGRREDARKTKGLSYFSDHGTNP